MTRFHIITNAHLDPVWLWDWREGLNEGIATCRAVLDLMNEFPELKFTRGEASVYEHIERHAPETFARIREKIAEGRWEVAGGNYVQPDTNLPATEVLARQFRRGLGYFRRALGVRPVAAWAADSFGHSAGCPAIYAAAGMKYFAFWRPFASELALPGPAFWWEAAGGERVLSWRIQVGWYGSTRAEIPGRLDAYREESAQWGVENVMVPLGLGNHGGGPSRAQIEAGWRGQNRDVEVVFSTLHGFFEALSAEAARLPVFRGELNFTLRGCYASAASVKFAYRRAENAPCKPSAQCPPSRAARGGKHRHGPPAPDLGEAWDAVLFTPFTTCCPARPSSRRWRAARGSARRNTTRARGERRAERAGVAVDTASRHGRPARRRARAVVEPNPHPSTGRWSLRRRWTSPAGRVQNKPDAVRSRCATGGRAAVPVRRGKQFRA
ncbi:hypothetical protein OH491_06760 [Termitidicoccus mucosus]|uniref:glycoside hydrolase family 38 N-terminal domain-containing protein n=1 Tax=Termitidicoccus mucosus TaxID=1184151 RepID=UPI003183E437